MIERHRYYGNHGTFGPQARFIFAPDGTRIRPSMPRLILPRSGGRCPQLTGFWFLVGILNQGHPGGNSPGRGLSERASSPTYGDCRQALDGIAVLSHPRTLARMGTRRAFGSSLRIYHLPFTIYHLLSTIWDRSLFLLCLQPHARREIRMKKGRFMDLISEA